jgi:hypothetical protein
MKQMNNRTFYLMNRTDNKYWLAIVLRSFNLILVVDIFK